MITADKIFKGSTEIIKVYQGLQLLWEKQGGPSIGDYIQDGLVFQLDGIDKGNVEGVWKDLINGREFTLNNCILNSNNVEFNGTDSYCMSSDTISYETYTLEITFIRDKISGVVIDGGNDFQMIFLKTTSGYERRYISGRKAMLQTRLDKVNILSIPTTGRPISSLMASPISPKTMYSTNTTDGTYIGCLGAAQNPFFKGKIYSIRVYNRNLTSEEMIHNQLLDIERFNLPGFEDLELTIEGDDGTPMTGARFALLKNVYTYDGKPFKAKIPAGTYYEIDFSCVPNYTACEFLGTYQAESGNVRKLKAIFPYDGWGDYFVSNINISGSIAEVRDGVTYYKLENPTGIFYNNGIKIYHWPNRGDISWQFGTKYVASGDVQTVPYIYEGTSDVSFNCNNRWGASFNFYNLVPINAKYYINGVDLGSQELRRFASQNILNQYSREHSTTYYNRYGNIAYSSAMNIICFSSSDYSQTTHVDTLILYGKDGSYSSVNTIDVYENFTLNRVPNLCSDLNWFIIQQSGWQRMKFTREGLLDALLTNSLDRSKLTTASLPIGSDNLNLLTDADKAQITAKGYSLS